MSVVHTCSSQLSITIRLVFVQNSRKLKEIFPQFTSFLRSRSRHTLCLQLSSNFTGKDWRKCSQKQGKGFEADNLKWNIWCCYFNVLQVLATAQAQCLQHCVALAYLAHFFFLSTLMQNHVYKTSRQKIVLVRLLFQEDGMLRLKWKVIVAVYLTK